MTAAHKYEYAVLQNLKVETELSVRQFSEVGRTKMSLAIWWKRDKKPGLVIMFLGIAGFVQIPILWHAETYLKVPSAEVQFIVAMGAAAVLGGAYVLMAEAMYRWANIVSKKKVRRRQRIKADWIEKLSVFVRSREDLPPFAGVALMTCVFLMLYFVPLGIVDVTQQPSWIATLAFIDPLFIYPLAVNIAAILTASIASYMRHNIK